MGDNWYAFLFVARTVIKALFMANRRVITGGRVLDSGMRVTLIWICSVHKVLQFTQKLERLLERHFELRMPPEVI